MKRSFLFLIFLVVLILSLNNFVKSEQAKFDQILPFTTPTGFLCLFDQKDGKIYIYDSNFSKCKFVLELKKLGEPIAKIK